MTVNRLRAIANVAALLLASLVFMGLAVAQSVQVRGIIGGRSGSSMTLQTDSET
jgi:hypothetical protein